MGPWAGATIGRVGAVETKLLINGERVAGQGGPSLEVENPFTEEPVATVGSASRGAARRRDRGRARGFRRLGAHAGGGARGDAPRGRERPASRTDELAELMTLRGWQAAVENADEVGWTAAAFDYYAEIGRDSAGRVIPSIESTQLALVVKDALGVVACIVPWNYPLLLLAWKLAPALAAGNTAVCKPSEVTPLSTLAIASCFDHLPAGVVNIVAGAGDVGAALAADERVDAVAFTGSVETGKKVAAACLDRMARVNLEMGGKDPFIVCSDVAPRSTSRRAAAPGPPS